MFSFSVCFPFPSTSQTITGMGLLEKNEGLSETDEFDNDNDVDNDELEDEECADCSVDETKDNTTQEDDSDEKEEEEDALSSPGKDPRILKWLSQSEPSSSSTVTSQMADLGFEEDNTKDPHHHHHAHGFEVDSHQVFELPQEKEHLKRSDLVMVTEEEEENVDEEKREGEWNGEKYLEDIEEEKSDEVRNMDEITQEENNEEEKEEAEEETGEDLLADLSNTNRAVRPFRDQKSLEHVNEHHLFESEASERGSKSVPSTACSSIAPEQARSRLRNQAKKKQQLLQARRVRKSGEASVVTKLRRENSDEVKQSLDAVWY